MQVKMIIAGNMHYLASMSPVFPARLSNNVKQHFLGAMAGGNWSSELITVTLKLGSHNQSFQGTCLCTTGYIVNPADINPKFWTRKVKITSDEPSRHSSDPGFQVAMKSRLCITGLKVVPSRASIYVIKDNATVPLTHGNEFGLCSEPTEPQEILTSGKFLFKIQFTDDNDILAVYACLFNSSAMLCPLIQSTPDKAVNGTYWYFYVIIPVVLLVVIIIFAAIAYCLRNKRKGGYAVSSGRRDSSVNTHPTPVSSVPQASLSKEKPDEAHSGELCLEGYLTEDTTRSVEMHAEHFGFAPKPQSRLSKPSLDVQSDTIIHRPLLGNEQTNLSPVPESDTEV